MTVRFRLRLVVARFGVWQNGLLSRSKRLVLMFGLRLCMSIITCLFRCEVRTLTGRFIGPKCRVPCSRPLIVCLTTAG